MEELLTKLYSYEYFSVYLIISIIVLVILFIIILFFGKKDQTKRELEATKKLEKIASEDTFKEEKTENKVEVSNEQEKLENDTIVVPTIEDIPVVDNEVPAEEPAVMSMEEEVVEEKPREEVPVMAPQFASPVMEPVSPAFESKEEDIQPIFEPTEQPLVVDNFDVKEETKEAQETVDAPVFNYSDLMNKEEENIIKIDKKTYEENFGPLTDNTSTPVEEKMPVAEEIPEVLVPSEEEIDMELPMLKKETTEEAPLKREEPVLSNYNFDDLSGETYTIK